ncbi:hypothetical protein HK100_007713 [Physocladia obscura]|uniref:Uncharacterized protein n=1 Tax=Physocladia obscura TaxID=109957 RepID=A0AAD5SNY1_9FUNG|nr:hypothetical protein HK100_007713 [Physocladia obscura]
MPKPTLARFSTNTESQRQLALSRRWIRLISGTAIATLLSYTAFLFYDATTSIPSLPAQTRQIPNFRQPKPSRIPAKTVLAVYLKFHPATNNVEVFGDPSNRTESARLQHKYAESARDFESLAFPQFGAALDRFEALDVGRYLTFPLLHFSLSQISMPSENNSFTLKPTI